MQSDHTVAIIGAGPIGIELAIALKKNGISFIQFDKGQAGQSIYDFPLQTHFFSTSEKIAIADNPIQVADQQKCTREEYLAYLRCCILEHNLQINTFEKVASVRSCQTRGKFILETVYGDEKRSYQTTFVVFATGGTAFSRKLGIPGENLSHVSSKLMEPHLYFQKQIAIVGSRNSAVEWALRAFHAGAKVTLISRREIFDTEHVKYWLLPELKNLVREEYIRCIFSTQVIEISANKLKLLNINGEVSEIHADFVVKAIGFLADMSLLDYVGVTIAADNIPLFNPETMETDIANSFVIGTATGGTQLKYKIFIENSHEHVNKVVEMIGARLGKVIKMQKKINLGMIPEQ